MSGKRVSLASLAGAKVEAVPGAGRPDLVHVHPDTVAPTPLNPRRDFEPEGLTELGEDMRAGQLQPCVAVPKAAYLKLYPEHAQQLSDGCRYVMAAGERRWRAALSVGLDSLDVLLRHDLTESRIRFLSAVLSENVQRANFNPIEEANGLRAMLDLHDGNQTAAAKSLKKSKQWFSQRIGLLRLTDDMVQLVLDGKLTAFREMRRYAAMPADEQHAAWKADQERPPTPRPAAAPPPPAPDPEAQPVYTAVYTPPTPAPEAATGFTAVKPDPAATPEPGEQTYTAVYTAPPAQPGSGPAVLDERITPGRQAEPAEVHDPAPGSRLPEARTSQLPAPAEGAPTTARSLPYDDGTFIGMHLIRRMSEEELMKVRRVLNEHAAQHGLKDPAESAV